MDQVAGDREIDKGALATERAAVTQARERLGQDLDRLDSEVRAQVAGGVQTLVWKLGAAGLGLAAATGVRKAMALAWRQTRKGDPPDDPSSPDTSWGEALAWTIAMGVGVGVARLLAERGAAAGWEKATGARPPHRA